MNHQMYDHLGRDTQFWIVRPRITPRGLSGLETIVSGAYIEMNPGKTRGSERRFRGLEQPPLQNGVTGSTFILHSDQMRSLSRGSSVYYRGISVGEVSSYFLAGGGAWVNIVITVRAPYDKLIHHESLFWNLSALSVSTSGAGLTATAASLESLIAGGIAFETPKAVLDQPASRPGTEFPLYDDENSAKAEPVGPRLYYLAEFPGSITGISIGSPVQLLGVDIGRVSDAHLEYDRSSRSLSTPVTLELRPDAIRNLTAPGAQDVTASASSALQHLIAAGLRAHLSSTNLITGQRKVALDFGADPPPVHFVSIRGYGEMPTVEAGDFDDLLRSANQSVNKINQLLNSAELKRSMKALDETLSNLESVSIETRQQVGPLMTSLRKSSEEANETLTTANRSLGGETGQNPDIARAVNELTDAARSIRVLADYLDRHPEALLRGRSDKEQ
jgi:paraquat-inducible protein B